MNKKTLSVLGTFMADLVTRTNRMPEWGETLAGSAFRIGPGGKGSNQAIAAARMGADVHLITRLGADPFGEMAQSLYEQEGIDPTSIGTDDTAPTGTASIFVDDQSGENAIVIVPGAGGQLTPEHVNTASAGIAASGLFLTQLELPSETIGHAIRIATDNAVPVMLNPAPATAIPDHWWPLISYVTPNQSEAAQLTGRVVRSPADAAKAASDLRDRGVPNVLITLGEQGVYVASPDFEGRLEAVSAGSVVDTTGAGDAFNGAFAAALLEGRSVADAAYVGNVAAGLSVSRAGAAAAMPTRSDVESGGR